VNDNIDAVEDLVWREVKRLEQDIIAAQNALACDGHRPEMQAAARALLKLSTTAGSLADKIRRTPPVPEP
jgi:hypothetical protein